MPNLLTVSGGNISERDADRLRATCRYPVPDWEPGSTEPWIIDCIAALLRASGQQVVLELGGYKGAASVALADTLAPIGGMLLVVEFDPLLVPVIQERLGAGWRPNVDCLVLQMDAIEAIQQLPDRSIGFVWLDDDHDSKHVCEEMTALIPKMRTGGIICFHDVCGAYRLWTIVKHWGGYSLDLARVSNSGGLGVLQVTERTREITPPEITWKYPDGSTHSREPVCTVNVIGDMEVPD